MDAKVATDATCHLLRVPAEIRLHIYRYLLLESPRASLDPSYPEKVFNTIMDQEYKQTLRDGLDSILAPEHGDADSEGTIPSEEEGTVMYNHLIPGQPPPSWESLPPPPAIDEKAFEKTDLERDERFAAERRAKFENEYKICRYPAVLRTNRQIHKEASALLYSTLVMEVRPGDLISSDQWDEIIERGGEILRFSLSASRPRSTNLVQKSESNGSLLRHNMDVQSFANLERVSFIADLEFIAKKEETLWPIFFIDDSLRTNHDDETAFTDCLNGVGSKCPPVSEIFGQLIDVLTQSLYISQLSVSLSVAVDVAFDIDSEDEDNEGDEDDQEDQEDQGDDKEEDLEKSDKQDEKEQTKINVANVRAQELVLEAGVLDPLKKLSNVKCFKLSVASPLCSENSSLPKSRLGEMVQSLKETIERNFVAKWGHC